MAEPMAPESVAQAVVQRQLDAYNARDLDAWLATYAEDARQYELAGKLLASGHAELRARTEVRFREPDLHAHLLQRSVMGNVVVDHEIVTRNFPEGVGTVEMVCVYVVSQGLIQTASFEIGSPTMGRRSA
ncbi:nuclear transport factor 2 family protein [Variovorax sp. W6]|uniref:nuclear transport factor 2 family protein n=1 Tax=Variovorax sp. W6 TaxID=3093895 RepID=UPI003D806A09